MGLTDREMRNPVAYANNQARRYQVKTPDIDNMRAAAVQGLSAEPDTSQMPAFRGRASDAGDLQAQWAVGQSDVNRNAAMNSVDMFNRAGDFDMRKKALQEAARRRAWEYAKRMRDQEREARSGALSGVLGLVGTGAGAVFGGPLGASLGGTLGSGLGKIL